MRTQWMVAALGAVMAGLPMAAGAQEGEAPRRLRVERYYTPSEFPRMLDVLVNRRARLGVKVSLQPSASDSIGATLDAVTPGGPAARAGLRSGDIITRLDGEPVARSGDARERDGQSAPGLRLIELAAQLAPNDTVTVDYRRGGEGRTATLITGDEPAGFAFKMGDGDFFFRGPGAGFGPEDLRGESWVLRSPRLEFFFGGPLADLELAPMNPDLGRYFGTADGVLVVSVPEESTLNLRGGDVILSVDGREPGGPAHLMRILGSYEGGETVEFQIMRDRKRQTVSGKVDARNRPPAVKERVRRRP